MDRKAFVKLAGCEPGVGEPRLRGMVRTVTLAATRVGPSSPHPHSTPRPASPFYSPLAEEWYRGGQYFEWASTTPNNEGRRVRVYHRTFGNRSNPALVILHGNPASASYDFREMISFLEEDYFVAVLDFPGYGFSDKPPGRLLVHAGGPGETSRLFRPGDRGAVSGSISSPTIAAEASAFSLLGDYLAREEKDYEITYHFISNGGLFLPLTNLPESVIDLLHPVRGPERAREQQAQPRVTEGHTRAGRPR